MQLENMSKNQFTRALKMPYLEEVVRLLSNSGLSSSGMIDLRAIAPIIIVNTWELYCTDD